MNRRIAFLSPIPPARYSRGISSPPALEPRSVRVAHGLILTFLGLVLPGCMFSEPVSETLNRQVTELETRPWDDPDEIVARVNEVEITRGDFYRRILERQGTLTLLTGLIKEELFLQEADRLGVTVSPQEVEALVEQGLEEEARRLAPRDADPMAELERLYASQGLSLQDVKRDNARMAAAQLRMQKVVKALRVITEAELREAYQRTYAQEQFRVSQIAYSYGEEGAPAEEIERRKARAMERALRAVRLIRNGADFGEMARGESEDRMTAESGSGGEFPFLWTRNMPGVPPQVHEAVFSLEPGEVSDPVDFPERGTLHIFKVTEILSDRSFVEVRDTLEKELREREPDPQEILETLETLGSRAEVEVFGRRVDASFKVPAGAAR